MKEPWGFSLNVVTPGFTFFFLDQTSGGTSYLDGKTIGGGGRVFTRKCCRLVVEIPLFIYRVGCTMHSRWLGSWDF